MFAKAFRFYSQPSMNPVFPAPNGPSLSQPSFDGTDFTRENTEVVFLKDETYCQDVYSISSYIVENFLNMHLNLFASCLVCYWFC